VETWTSRDGVYLAVQAKHKESSIKGDNLIVTQALKGINYVPGQSATIIEGVFT